MGSFLFAFIGYSQPYFFTTLAGNAGSGFADGVGSNARFDFPLGVAVDSATNIYVADHRSHVIRKITPEGTNWVVSTVAGSAGRPGSTDGVGRDARFCWPSAVAVDGAGNVYVADSYNYTIRKITPAGAVSTLAGLAKSYGSADGVGSDARFGHPEGIAVDSGTNLYVADYDKHTIRKVVPDGTNWVVSTVAGLAGTAGSSDGVGSNARFCYPSGVAVDSDGNLYVADSSNQTIRKMTPAGVVSTLAGLAQTAGSSDGTGTSARFNYPSSVAVNAAGKVYVADSHNEKIRQITPAGVVSSLAGQTGTSGSNDGYASLAMFHYPAGVAVDSAGMVYVADSSNGTIRKVTPSGTVTTIAGLAGGTGSADGIGSAARFYYPYGVAVDSAGKVYVADQSNDTIRQITRGGVVTTLAGQVGVTGWGNGVGTGAQFSSPRGVAVDSATNVYVADTFNATIRKISPGAVVTTVAGLARSTGNVDGAGSNARFSAPAGIAVDTWGNVYVADYSANTIRKMTPGGVVNTLAGRAFYVGSGNGVGTNATFNQPRGVAVDNATNIYVADFNNHAIRKVAPVGTNWVVSTFAGLAGTQGSSDGAGSNARFRNPSGVAVDGAGNLYVADTANHTIRKITPAGVVSTVAGLAMIGGAANGAGENARFYTPTAVAVDSMGNLYVADNNTTIRLGFPPPSLGFNGSANLLILSWPITASNYVLEASGTLSPDSTWSLLTNGLSTVGDSFIITNNLAAAAQFYRLRLP